MVSDELTLAVKCPNADWSTYADDLLCTRLGGEHAENTRSTSNVEDPLPLEELFVLQDGVAVGGRPDGVLEHLFVNACVGCVSPVLLDPCLGYRAYQSGHTSPHSCKTRFDIQSPTLRGSLDVLVFGSHGLMGDVVRRSCLACHWSSLLEGSG